MKGDFDGEFKEKEITKSNCTAYKVSRETQS